MRRSFRSVSLSKRLVLALPVLASALVWPSTAHAQLTSQESEFQVNSYTMYGQSMPALDSNASGQFVAVWRGDYSLGDDTSSGSTQGRRFSSNGDPIGADFQVNTYTTSNQRDPDVAVNPDGSFVVVWAGQGIAARLYDSEGSPVGAQFQINTDPAAIDEPAVSSAASGEFVVVYHSRYGVLDPSGYGILGQRFSSVGGPLGSEFRVNDFTTGNQKNPEVVMAADGSFAVVWQSLGSSGSDSLLESIQGKRYSSLGGPIGTDFQINSYTTGSQQFPSIGQDSTSTFTVAWQGSASGDTDTSAESIHARRWNGAAIGEELQINIYTTNGQIRPSVACDENGGFVVTWQSGTYGSLGPDGSQGSIRARKVASNGVAEGDEVQVNTYTTNHQAVPLAGYRGGGEFVIVWQSNGSSGPDQSADGVLGQRFLDGRIFSSYFESGDATDWSSTVGGP